MNLTNSIIQSINSKQKINQINKYNKINKTVLDAVPMLKAAFVNATQLTIANCFNKASFGSTEDINLFRANRTVCC